MARTETAMIPACIVHSSPPKSSPPWRTSRWMASGASDCSILRAVELVKDAKADAIISPGNTGGLSPLSSVRLRRIGIEHPAIATVIPAEENEFALLDAGASVECSPPSVAFCHVRYFYSKQILGYKSPRVGILSNGTESHKGTVLDSRKPASSARWRDSILLAMSKAMTSLTIAWMSSSATASPAISC